VVARGQTVVGVSSGPKNFGDAETPPLGTAEWLTLTPQSTSLSHTCDLAEFGLLSIKLYAPLTVKNLGTLRHGWGEADQ